MKLRVMPRYWFMGEDFDKSILHYRVTLDNTEKEYDFSFDVTRREVLMDSELPQRRFNYAAKVLLEDYRKRNP